MKRQPVFSLAVFLFLSATPKIVAAGERPRVELKGVFGSAGFWDAERHDVAGMGVRFSVTERFSIEPEVLFLRAPLACFRCEDGRDEDLIAVSNFVYRLDAPDASRRVSPYFLAGLGYMHHSERRTYYTAENRSLWMHFGLGLKVRVTDRLSLLPEYRVGVAGGSATLSASYGWFPTQAARVDAPELDDDVVAVNLAELEEKLPNGGPVDIRYFSGERVSGVLRSFAEEGEAMMLEVEDRSRPLEVPLNEVYRVDARVHDPLTNGIYIGAGVGAALGLLAAAACDCEGAVYGALFTTGLGASIGMLTDASLRSRRIVYLRPPRASSGVDFRLAPYMTRDKKGLLAVLSF